MWRRGLLNLVQVFRVFVNFSVIAIGLAFLQPRCSVFDLYIHIGLFLLRLVQS